ncbi:acyltransferase family protein [Pseudofrankia asymbiotica]|uniref:Acyltransferase n=1 Tax=Pseudofrankia asymbiotica TaxID=1834516 RepID=A0A1V2IFQ5_9ACTN|nr:acyltransferase [Pseudofrankia asymbiotica]ONH31994.1 acyltransferase [Pseudofrankia asymbiotica]
MTGAGLRQLGRPDDPTTVAVDAGTTIVSEAPQAPADAGPATTPAGPRRDATIFPGFDGLRAIAALLVIVVHVGFVTNLTLRTSLGPYAARAEIGVAVFFLISGFLLYRPFVARHLALADHGGGRDVPDAGGFLLRRFMRIVPLYWLVFVVSLVVVTDRMLVANIPSLIECLLFVQGYRKSWALQGLTQAWSLDVEVAFYLFVPLYAWLLGRRVRTPRTQLWLELTGVAGLYLVGTLVHWRMIGTTFGPADNWSVWLPVWWDLFSSGMFLAVVSAWYGRQGRHPRWSTLPFSGTVCWLLAAVCYWVASRRIGLPLWPIYDVTVRTDMGKHLFYGLFGFFLLLPAVFGPQRRGLVRRFLASRVMTFLGSVSYGIYLWHQTVIDVVMARGGWKIWQVSFLPFFAVVVVITVALSTLTYYLVERPCQNLARDWARRWKNRPRRDRGRAVSAPSSSARHSASPSGRPAPALLVPVLPTPASAVSASTTPASAAAPASPAMGSTRELLVAGGPDETTIPPLPEPHQPDRVGWRDDTGGRFASSD